MSILHSRDLTVGYDRRIVVEELSVSIPEEKITAIVGANGSGKSTVLKAFSRILKPLSGGVYLDDDAIHSMPSRQLALRLSVLPQGLHAPESLTVWELVSYGRYPHRRWLGAPGRDDTEMVRWALGVTGIGDLEDRPVNTLSEGQQQRAWIAMTLSQGARFLLLDEPTSHLDTSHQLEIMELLKRLNRHEGKTIVMVLHDLNLAARYAHHMIALKGGRIIASGAPEAVMTEAILHDVFGIRAHVTRDPFTHAPMCIAYAASTGPSPDEV